MKLYSIWQLQASEQRTLRFYFLFHIDGKFPIWFLNLISFKKSSKFVLCCINSWKKMRKKITTKSSYSYIHLMLHQIIVCSAITASRQHRMEWVSAKSEEIWKSYISLLRHEPFSFIWINEFINWAYALGPELRKRAGCLRCRVSLKNRDFLNMPIQIWKNWAKKKKIQWNILTEWLSQDFRAFRFGFLSFFVCYTARRTINACAPNNRN